MSWSVELWDQFDTISNHTAKGIEFLDRLGHFVKDRCLIETDYASRLRKLSKNYDLKKKDDEREFTYCKAFAQVLKEVSDMAGQHEVIAENLSAQIVREISLITKDLKDERKRHLSEGIKYQNVLSNSLNQLDKSKKCYDKAFRESVKADENFEKADKDLNLSRADLEKARTIKRTKEASCENSKSDYAKQLEVANQAQREHYTQFMPKVFQQLQDMENKRIECTRNFMKLSAIIQKNVVPIINKCLDGVIESANSIDSQADAQLVVERYKSGMQPPDDIPFEDLSTRVTNCETESTQSKGSSLVYTHSLKSDSLRHTFTARGLKKRTRLLGIFGANKNDYSDLPPNQKRKKIQSKIDQLNSQISQANGVKDGLIIMRQAYEENEAFGDPKTIESQLRENEATLERLQQDLQKHLVLLDELELTKGTNNNQMNTTHSSIATTTAAVHQQYNNDNDTSKSPSITNSNHRASIGQESEMSRTNSENSLRPESNNREATKSSATNRTSNSFNDSISDSISNNALSPIPNDTVDGVVVANNHNNSAGSSASSGGGNPLQNHNTTTSATKEQQPVTIATSNSNNNSVASNNNQQQDYNSDGYETPSELPVQATARALYPFKAEPAGSISMVENEVFDVIELDQGDGWTRVRRKVYNSEDEDYIGFVPTSYIALASGD